MTSIYRSYQAGEEIPVAPRLHKRKLLKYYSREAMAAVLTASEFLEGKALPPRIPFYYASAYVENLSFLEEVFSRLDAYPDHVFTAERFLLTTPPPVNFKMMRNMVPCFISIENQLTGDSNFIVDSASALLYAALTAPGDGPVLMGAGYMHADGAAEAGFALVQPAELAHHPLLGTDVPALELFRKWQ